jgi:hypothetical protein
MKRSCARALGVFSLTLLGCVKASAPPQSPNASTPATCEKVERDSRQAHALLERYCLTCHAPGGDAGDEHDFSGRELSRAQNRSISARLRAHSMPPRTSLQPTPAERSSLARWAECGAARFSGAPKGHH